MHDRQLDVTGYAEGLRAWLATEADALAPHRTHRPGPIEDALRHEADLQRLLWDAGWSRVGWPKRFGGRDGSARLRATLYDVLTVAGIVLPEAMTTAEVMAPAVITYAPHLADRHLADYLRGDEAWCQCFSEPDAGSDMAAIRATATRDGESYRLEGQKTWSSLATVADRSLVLLRTGDRASRHRGLGMFLVDLHSSGVEVRPIRAATGRNEFAEIFFDGTQVPAEQLVGAEDEGWAVAMSMLQWERGMFGWQRQAVLHQRLGSLAAHVSPRHTSDLGAAVVAVHELRMQSRRTVARLAEGEDPGPEISIDKLLLSRAERVVHDLTRAVLEPRLELSDDPMYERLREEFIYSRASTIYGGTAEIQRNIVADRLLPLPKETARV